MRAWQSLARGMGILFLSFTVCSTANNSDSLFIADAHNNHKEVILSMDSIGNTTGPTNGVANTILSENLPIRLSEDSKIAFLFMSRGHMPLEDIWREFFRWKTNSSHFSIYVHTHPNFRFPQNSFFYGKQLSVMEDVKWGGISQIRGMKRLVRDALNDPLNAWFLLMSESCIPLHPFPVFRNNLLKFDKSIVNACDFGANVMETEARWRPSLDQVGLNKTVWRKSANWFAMNRKHSLIFTEENKLENAWASVPCADEHYLPTILAYYGLDNETTCGDGFVHVFWRSDADSHPWSYDGNEITPELFRHLNEPAAAHPGFSKKCSGVPGLCHFTARKFGGAVKYQLLENLDLILSDDITGQYDGNPWDHHQDKMRDSNGTYYLIENGLLRLLPDKETIFHMHLNASLAKPLDTMDTTAYHFGPPFPSRRDGQMVRFKKSNYIFYIKDGRRHGIPNMDTFYTLNMSMSEVKLLSPEDLNSIVLGEPWPDINKIRPHGN